MPPRTNKKRSARVVAQQQAQKKTGPFVPKKTRWTKQSLDYSYLFTIFMNNYGRYLCGKLDDLRVVLCLMKVSKSVRSAVLECDEVWFRLGAMWEDDYFSKVKFYDSVAVRSRWVVKGVFNRPNPDFELHSTSTPGITNRNNSLCVEGKLVWNGHGKIFTKAEAAWVGQTKKHWNSASNEDKEKLRALGRSYTPEEYRTMARYFRKCFWLINHRDCMICSVRVDTVPIWALGGRVCRGCLSDNLLSSVVLFERHNIDISKVIPYITGRVWFFKSVHHPIYNARNFSSSVSDIKIETETLKKAKGVMLDVFVWMPHLEQVMHIPDCCGSPGSQAVRLVDGSGRIFDDEEQDFVPFAPSMLPAGSKIAVAGRTVIPRGFRAAKQEAAGRVAAWIRAFCVRYRYAAFTVDDKLDELPLVGPGIRHALELCYQMHDPGFDSATAARMLSEYYVTTHNVSNRGYKLMEAIVLRGMMRIGAGRYGASKPTLVTRVSSAEALRGGRSFTLEYPKGCYQPLTKQKNRFEKRSNFVGDPAQTGDDWLFSQFNLFTPGWR